MRSLIGTIVDRAPVPYVSTRPGGGGFAAMLGSNREDRGAQLGTMAAVGTLFSIVNRTSTATAKPKWHLHVESKGSVCERCEAAGLEAPDVKLVDQHASLDVLNAPNDFFTRQELFESVQQHVDLTGEGWLVVARDPRVTLPLELWFARPDRMRPVPDKDKFIVGYLYTDPDGNDVALELNQVMQIRMPNPLDPYRGLGPVQALLTDLDSVRYSKEWNRRFFLNDATPGGVIEVEEELSDPDFDRLRKRWDEQHRGVANAHRVAILEGGAKWADKGKFTMRDMQFTELGKAGREVIREGFGMPSFLLGLDDIPNRATADASEVYFGRHLAVPRLDRWAGMLTNDFLPMFGTGTRGYSFAYDNPVPKDKEAENAERASKAGAAKELVDAGYDGTAVAEYLGYPDALTWSGRPAAPSPVAPSPAPDDGAPADRQRERITIANRQHNHDTDEWLALIGQLVPRVVNADDAPDLSGVQLSWERRLAALVRSWVDVAEGWRDRIYDQVRAAVNNRQPTALAQIKVPTAHASELVGAAMTELAREAAEHVVGEAKAQGVTVTPRMPAPDVVSAVAETTADLLGKGYSDSAAAEALRRYTPAADGDQVARDTVVFLRSLSDAHLEERLGGALTRAQNDARTATFEHAPAARYFAHEKLDTNTCAPCRHIDGQELPTLEAATLAYGGGPYLLCEGRWRCRGTYYAVYDLTAIGPEPPPAAPAPTPRTTIPAEAKPFHRSLDAGQLDLSERVADVRRAERAGGDPWKNLSGGISAQTRMAVLSDGRKVINKEAPEWGDPDAPRTQADAEQLASMVAHALDVPAPRAYRTAAESVWLEVVDGKTLGQLVDEGESKSQVQARFTTDAGKRMGLFHVLAAHNDPNDGNLMVDADGTLVSIDHGFAFAMRSGEPHPNDIGGTATGRPAGAFIRHDEVKGSNEWRSSNPLTPSDVKIVRKRLKALRADFRKLGREGWLDGALAALDELELRAAGKVDLYG